MPQGYPSQPGGPKGPADIWFSYISEHGCIKTVRGNLCSLEKALLDSSWLLSSSLIHRSIDADWLAGWLADWLLVAGWRIMRGVPRTHSTLRRGRRFFSLTVGLIINTYWSKLELETVWIIMPLVKVYHLNWKRSFDLIVATVVLSYLGIFVQITFMPARCLIDFLLGTILEGPLF